LLLPTRRGRFTAFALIMPASKPGFLLLDFPDESEIAEDLSTEGGIIETILHRRGKRRRITRIRAISAGCFRKTRAEPLDVRFVHLSAHADRAGIGFLKGEMSWREFAELVVSHLAPRNNERRVMVFSCCHSREGFEATKRVFENHFTAAYLFEPEEPDFCDALAIWAMFYLKKNARNPHKQIVDDINRFVGRRVLRFKKY
jgi:hypothetical protein